MPTPSAISGWRFASRRATRMRSTCSASHCFALSALPKRSSSFQLALQARAAGCRHHMNLGYALLRSGNRPRRCNRSSTRARLPQSTEIQFYLGLALRANGRFASAKTCCNASSTLRRLRGSTP
jgi:hypothetical protein